MTASRIILAGVDREGESVDAVGLAGSIAKVSGAELHLVHVVETPHRPWPFAGGVPEDAVAKAADAAFAKVQPALPAGLAAKRHVRHGHPVKQLAEAVGDLRADLLVLGRPHGGAAENLLGGTAQRLVRLCPTPILVHKARGRELPRRVLVAVDLSDVSLHALDVAIGWCRRLPGSSVAALYVFEPPDFAYHTMGVSLPQDVVAEVRQRETAGFRERLEAHDWQDVPHELRMVEGEPSVAILDEARAAGADLVVLGTHGRSGIDRFLLGSVAEYVSRRAEVAVLIVPPPTAVT